MNENCCLFVNQIFESLGRYYGTIKFNDSISGGAGGYEASYDEMKYLGFLLMSKHQITVLDLSFIKFSAATSEYFQMVLKYTCLNELKLIVQDENDFGVLRGLEDSKVEQLNLNNSRISQIDPDKLFEFLKNSNVKFVFLKHCEITDEIAVLFIDKLKKLGIHLMLSFNKISDNGMEPIAETLIDGDFDQIYLNYEDGRILSVQRQNENIYTQQRFALLLEFNEITGVGRFLLIHSLAAHHKLVLRVKLEKKYKIQTVFEALMEDDLENPTDYFDNFYQYEVYCLLKNIKFQGIFITNSDLADEHLDPVIETLKRTGMENLSIFDNLITNDGVRKLVQALPETKINNLYLVYNKFDGDGTKVIANNIRNTQINRLFLAADFISTKGINAIINIIPTSNLVELGLGTIFIDNKLLIKIANAVVKSNIKKLDITCDNYGTTGANAMIRSLPKTKIAEILFGENAVNNSNAVLLMQTVIKCKISGLGMVFDKISPKVLETFGNLLKDYYLLIIPLTDYSPIRMKKIVNRNVNTLSKAIEVLNKFQRNKLTFDNESKNDLEAFQLVCGSLYLSEYIDNAQLITHQDKHLIFQKINDNFFQISGIINKKLTSNDTDYNKINISDCPPEVLSNICSYLPLTNIKNC